MGMALVVSGGADTSSACTSARSEALLANRIVAQSQSYRKDNPAEYLKVRAYLDGGARPTGVTSHMGLHLLYGEDACRGGGGGTTTTTTTTSTTTTTTTSPPPGSPTLQQIDGGTSYYAQFTNTQGMDAASYFPIAVWGSYSQTQSNLNIDAGVGINTYVWAADSNFMDEIRADGRFKVIQDESSRSNIGSETDGWLLGDEIDMTQGPGACPNAINAIKAGLPNDGRFRYTNYGKGVLNWGTVGVGGHTDTSSACFINAQDVTSADLYWHTDPYENQWPQWHTSWGYGWSMERMRQLDATDGVRKPQWGFVEVGHPFDNGGTITPAQIRGAVWHTLIGGARGLIYFQHSFGGSCPNQLLLRSSTSDPCYGAVVTMVTSINAQIKALAPVLNSPFVTSGHSASTSIDHMVKWDGTNFYVFAAARSGGSATMSIPCVGNATATVLNEGRSVSV